MTKRLGVILLLLTGCAASVNQRGVARGDVAARLAQVRAFRESRHVEAAVVQLDLLLRDLAHAGGTTSLDAPTQTALQLEVQAAQDAARTAIVDEASAGHPLAAEARLTYWSKLLTDPSFAPALAAARPAVQAAGQATCARLKAEGGPEATYWTWLTGRYCTHFGVAATEEAPALAWQIGKVEVSGPIGGLNADELELVRARFSDWVRRSVWYAPGGALVARAELQGRADAAFEHRTIALHAQYKAHVRGTTWSTPTYGAGKKPFGAGPVPSVTTGSIDQTYTYDVDETRGRYGLNLSARIDLAPDVPPVSLRVRRAEALKGYDHDTTFAPAGILPQHDPVPTISEWIARQLELAALKVVWQLNRRFITANCERTTYSADEAARCLYVGQKPAPVRDIMAKMLGEDPEPVYAMLRSTPAKPAKKDAGTKKPEAAPVIDVDIE